MLPSELIKSLRGIPGFTEQAFLKTHEAARSPVSIRINQQKLKDLTSLAEREANPDGMDFIPRVAGGVPWCRSGFYLDHRPSFTFDPLFHAGAYYVQEASSMFLEQAFSQTIDVSQDIRVLDLCAAPGGKSTLLQSLISDRSLLVSNEVIRQRAAILEENMIKWGGANVIVTNNDPKDFSRLEGFFDVMVVDAPCSGSGLFRRDEEAVKEWSEANVLLCSQRQQRILADAWPCLKEDGILIYATCSFSREEDEDNMDWVMNNLGASSIRLALKEEWGVVETVSATDAYGYRFWPDQVKGEGFFISVFRKREPALYRPGSKKMRPERAGNKELALLQPWLRNAGAGQRICKLSDLYFTIPDNHEESLAALLSASLYLRMSGCRLGKLAGKDLIPDHALALSTLLEPGLVAIKLKYPQAIQYLRKDEVQWDSNSFNSLPKGWALAKYEDVNLGWVKLLSNRLNNYYPKEWRILKKG